MLRIKSSKIKSLEEENLVLEKTTNSDMLSNNVQIKLGY
jgi:hypothetical protein